MFFRPTIIYLFVSVLAQPGLERNPIVGNPASDIGRGSAPNFRDTGILTPGINPERALGPSTASAPLSTCPNIMCTMEYIPEECAVTPVRLVNGVPCKGCPAWKESCRNRPVSLPAPVPDMSPPPEVACPMLDCGEIAIPPGCEYFETYDYLGRKCEKCPVWRSGCTESSGQITCPLQSCTLEFIPPQCKEVPTYTFMGRKCEKCPRRKKNCNPSMPGTGNTGGTVSVPEIPRVACPLVVCNERIPADCQVKNTYTVNGQICDACPTWDDKCKPPSENLVSSNRPRIACPLFDCPGNIPSECIIHQPYEFEGQTCFKCPYWRVGCIPSSEVEVPRKACPMMRCEPVNAPLECVQDTFYNFEGRQCQGCPGIKPECKPLVKPSGETLNKVLTEVINITNSEGCPPQRCPFIYIPTGCEERESFTFEGKTCYKCPRRRKDCGQEVVRCPPVPCPFIYIPPECEEKQPYEFQGRTCYKCPKRKQGCKPNSGQSPIPFATLDEISNNVDDPMCPAVKCPLIMIPKLCEEKQPFEYKGRTCYGCPKWRRGCSPDNSNKIDPDFNKVACPLFGCPRIYIPQECIEEQPYNFKGKVCYMCPKWREGCVPKIKNDPINDITSNRAGNNQNTDVISIDTVPSDKVACPLFKCPRIRIPEECTDSQPYEFNGKTCYKCPRWRPGCVPGQATTNPGTACPLVACGDIKIPKECREETPYFVDGKTCYGCPKFRDGCVPARQISPGDIACPLMACDRMFIPQGCKEEHPYEFQGKTCYKCPTLKRPCIPDAGGSMIPRVECPLLDCPKVRIPEECLEVKTYKFQGRQCQKCPSWKIGCDPKVPVRLVSKKKSDETTKVIGVPGVIDLSCPIPKCPRIRIPEECKLEQSYQFQGKTCYKCPIWRPGCIPSPSKPKTTEPTIADKSKETGTTSPLELSPRRLIIEANMAAITCPKLPCPRIRIPVYCQEQTTYDYLGKTCIGCPTWSSRCDGRGQAQNMNMNG